MTSTGPRTAALVEAARQLWPAAEEVVQVRASTAPRDDGVIQEFLLVPSARTPRLLVPARHPRATAHAVQRMSQSTGPLQRLARITAGLGLRTGVMHHLPSARVRVQGGPGDAPSVETWLSGLLGEDVVVSIGVGTDRANRKPVLEVLTRQGRTAAFVKVGDTPDTRDLVDVEAANLRIVSSLDLATISPPRVLHHGDFGRLRLLVLSPLRSAAWRRTSTTMPHAAMDELARSRGVDRVPLVESASWIEAAALAGALRDRSTGARLAEAMTRLGDRQGGVEVTIGCAHGDWTPWNMARSRDGVLLWDWERFGTGAAAGTDHLHWTLQCAVRNGRGWGATVHSLETDAADLLARPQPGADAAEATVVGYLTSLCARYLSASETSRGDVLRARAAWLLDHLESIAARSQP